MANALRMPPDGVCMNCRWQQGRYYPKWGYYVCPSCQAEVDQQMRRDLVARFGYQGVLMADRLRTGVAA